MSGPVRHGTPVAVALGSSVPGGARLLRHAADLIGRHPDITVLAVSHVVKSPPFGGEVHHHFDNAVLVARTILSPRPLLRVLWSVEYRLGRTRHLQAAKRKNGPRTLDLDLVHYGSAASTNATLTLPHPGAFIRDFVTAPLRDAVMRARFVPPTQWRVRALSGDDAREAMR